MNKKNNRKGFTTVELVIVIAVIAILATVLIPTFSNLIGKANQSNALSEANSAFKNYTIEHATEFGTQIIYIFVDGDTTKTEDDLYFKAEKGQLNDKPVAKPTGANDIVIKSDAAAEIGFACVSHDISKKDCGVCGTKHEHDFGTDPETHDCACGEPKPAAGN